MDASDSAIWWMLTRWRQVRCNLQVKLCDPWAPWVYEVLRKERCLNPLTSTFTFIPLGRDNLWGISPLRSVSPAGNRCHLVLLDKDESCPTADLSNIRVSQWSGLFNRWAVEHAPGLVEYCDVCVLSHRNLSPSNQSVVTSRVYYCQWQNHSSTSRSSCNLIISINNLSIFILLLWKMKSLQQQLTSLPHLLSSMTGSM